MIFHLSYDDLLQWAMKQEGFWEQFEDTMREIREEFFRNYYSEVEDEDAD
jgi:negative regulator of genetic competence, sporulation and motility